MTSLSFFGQNIYVTIFFKIWAGFVGNAFYYRPPSAPKFPLGLRKGLLILYNFLVIKVSHQLCPFVSFLYSLEWKTLCDNRLIPLKISPLIFLFFGGGHFLIRKYHHRYRFSTKNILWKDQNNRDFFPLYSFKRNQSNKVSIKIFTGILR